MYVYIRNKGVDMRVVLIESTYKVSDIKIIKKPKGDEVFSDDYIKCVYITPEEEYKLEDTISLAYYDVANKIWFTHSELDKTISEKLYNDILSYYETHQTYTECYDNCMSNSNDKGFCYNECLDDVNEYMGKIFYEVFTKEYVATFIESKRKYLENFIESYSEELHDYTNKRKSKTIKDTGEKIEPENKDDEIVDIPEEEIVEPIEPKTDAVEEQTEEIPNMEALDI